MLCGEASQAVNRPVDPHHSMGVEVAEAICVLCQQPMPSGEDMFKFHGYSGPCPPRPLVLNATAPVVGLVVPSAGALPQELPVVTPDMLARIQQAVTRDRLYADAKAVAARLRRQLMAGQTVASEEVEILVAYFLDAV